MSLRWPDIDLLRNGRGDLIALSPLSEPAERQAMTAALRRLKPAFAAGNDNGPDVAIIEALAACVEVMGFYHDRFLTESKLGSAQLLEDLKKLVALIGYRPLPSVAATALQFFEAITAGTVIRGTRVAGKILVPPATVTYETSATIDISPELNHMALSPLITRSPGAVRAILAPQARGTALPTDDFRPQTAAMIADAAGLELAPIAESRSRGVAFGRALSRSFEQAAQVSRTTVIRRLRGARGLADDLVAFEVSTAPILHLPSVAAPELLTSTLEIFVLRPGDEALDPSEWPPALRYQEVFDFSASEAADLHYRTFVDDSLHTWIILRTALGAQPLLDAAALQRVYARFVPAVGSMLGDAAPVGTSAQGPSPIPDLAGVTLGLSAGYFATSLVLPPVANTRLKASATWAMVDRDLGLIAGDSILIQDGKGGAWVRTLIDRPPGASPRLLRWAAGAPSAAEPTASLRGAHDPVDGALDPASAKIVSLTDAANGDVLPTWSELYTQLQPPAPPEAATDLPIVPSSPAGVIERQRVVAAGSTYLILRDASHVSPGDFVLLGDRLTAAVRAPQPFGDWRWKPGELPFDPRTPWLDAEVVQALEVRGNVVRLATPVSQDYFVHQGRLAGRSAPTPLSEVIALPGVVSVASGDQLRQTLSLSTQPVFNGNDGQLHDASYVSATLDRGHLAGDLRRPLLPEVAATSKPATVPAPRSLWDTLFVAVAGVAEAQDSPTWTFDVVVRAQNLRASLDQIARLENDDGHPITGADIGKLPSESELPILDAIAANSITWASDSSVVAVLATPPVWRRVDGAPGANEFRVLELVSFDLIRNPLDSGSATLLADGGTMILIPGPAPGAAAPAPFVFDFTWDPEFGAPHVQGTAPALTSPFEAVLVSKTQGVDLHAEGAATATADWLVPRDRFVDPAFCRLPAGSLVATSADHRIVLACPFTPNDAGLELDHVPVASAGDPLAGCADVWAVLPDDIQIAASAASARWVYELAADDPGTLPPSSAIRLALAGARKQIVRAHTGADGRSAVVDPHSSDHGDLGFALDALYGLEAESLPGAQIDASEIWAWDALEPPLVDLPEPGASRLVAVIPALHGGAVRTATWRRKDVWWDAERRTLRLPTAPLAAYPDVRPSDLVRLLQALVPAIDARQLAIQYDAAADRSIVTMAIAPGWPSIELAPAPVVIATLAGAATQGHGGPAIEIRDTAGPVDVFTTPEGSVRWTLHFTGDVRRRWSAITIALRDWPAPGERGLAAAPLWRVTGPASWRARAAAGPVTLIVTTRDQIDYLALAAMPRLAGDGTIELAPIGRDNEFPAAASVDQLDLAIYERRAGPAAGPHASLALAGTTILDLDATAGGEPPPITHVVFENDTAWQPIPVERTTVLAGGGHRYKLGRTYSSLFPDGFPRRLRVRLCYGTSQLAVPASPAIARTLRFRLTGLGVAPARGVAANAAVFHSKADFSDYLVLDASSAPTVDGDALVVELALDASGLGKIFTDLGVPKQTSLGLAQHWPATLTKSLVPQPLRIELGGDVPYAIAEGDVIHLGFLDNAPVTTTVRAYHAGGLLDLTPTAVSEPDELILYGLRTPIDPSDYGATLVLMPSSPQPPWLWSFDHDASPSSLLDTLLPYAKTEVDAVGQQIFRFCGDPKLVEIFRRAGDATLYLFSNERAELRGDFYTGSDDHVARDLAMTPPPNFLTAPDTTVVDQLILTSSAWAGQRLDAPRPVVLGSTAWTPQPGESGLPPARFPELKIESANPRRVATNTVLQSIRFNTGNFIPIASQGTSTTNPATLIASALRISARPVDRDGNPIAGQTWRPVKYISLDELNSLSTKLPTGTLASFEGMTFREAVLSGALQREDTKYVFSASFSPAGVCTLHFLFIDEALIGSADVRIEAQYEVTPGRTGTGLTDPIYPLETAVVPFDPATRLALLAPGQLKPGALVFVRQPASSGVPELQWARVAKVTGPIVEVTPPLAYAATAGTLEPIEVTALGNLQNAAKLDAEYYAMMTKAKLVPVPPSPDAQATEPAAPESQISWLMPLHDRLPLDIFVRPVGTTPEYDSSLLASLIPGDIVLVFDERKRRAWGEHRRDGVPDSHPTAPDWQEWPDFQHQAVVKAVEPDTGLLVLGAPLPDSFQVRCQLDTLIGRLTMNPDDVAALRVLPHYRAPVQGPRTLSVLGSGDHTRRFARFLASLDADTGNAVIPLASDGVTTGNLEVLAFDPETAKWSRWLRYDVLSRAGKKDPAFTLGFRPTTPTGQVPVSVTFGDGVTGQLLPTGTDNVYLRTTEIGAGTRWLPQPRPVRIVSSELLPGPIEVAPRVAAPVNLKLRLESTAPLELIGSRDLGAAQWRPSLQLTVVTADGPLEFTELTLDQAAGGAHGFLLSDLDTPPGTVDVYLYSQAPVSPSAAITAVQLAGSRLWSLDKRFYTTLSTNDLTDRPGATSIQLLSTDELRAGSLLAVSLDDASPPDIVHLASIDPPTWSAVVDPPLPRAYDLARSFIRGNLAPIIQGTVDRTTIGSSDGTTPSLRLPLQNRSPLLYVIKPGKEPEPDVTVLVAGQPWTPVLDFTGKTPADRVWRLDVDPDGAAFVVFGDGKQGAIPRAGRDNIDAIMRLGSGAVGNLAAGAIGKLVSGNLAVKSTTNLTPAVGGSAGDSPAVAREKAYARRLPSDRVVSAGDCVRAALGESGVIAAALDPTFDPTAPTGTLRLVVAMEDRRPPSLEDLAAVHDQVAAEMPVTAHVHLDVVAAEQSAVHLVIEIGVDAAHAAADVFAAVTAAFGAGEAGFFAADRWDIGEPLRLGTIYDAIFQIAGVAHARVLWMAGTPLVEGEAVPGPAPDVFDPGATGVVRCDNDPIGDPFGRFGTFRIEPAEATP